MIRVRPNWRNTVVEDKVFKIEDHKNEIAEIAKLETKQIKAQLKNELSQFVKSEIAKNKPENGKDANRWHLLESVDNEQGSDGDLAFVDGEIYLKESGEWTIKGSIRPKKTLVTGGVSEAFVNDAINNALEDFSPGGASEVTVTKTDNWTVTNETHVHMIVTSQKTVTLPATNTRKVTIKNSPSSTANIILSASGSTLDGQSDWTIRPGAGYVATYLGAGAYDVT